VFDLGLILMVSRCSWFPARISLLASTVGKTRQAACVMFCAASSLSGFFFPVEAMPAFLRFVSAFVPLRYFLVIIRALMLKGVGVGAIWNQILAVAVFAIVIMGAAAMRFRKRLD
jgi:ABC-2 type transport system permease protein